MPVVLIIQNNVLTDTNLLAKIDELGDLFKPIELETIKRKKLFS